MSTLPGRAICGVLIVFSVCSWTVMLMKLFRMSRWNHANSAFLHVFRHASHPLAVFQSSEHYELAPYYHIYHKSSRELAFQLAGVDLPDKTFATRLQGSGRITPSQMASVHAALDRAVTDTALKLEARMSMVAVALSGAPFIGLLGTVWGVMDSLAALAESGTPASLPAMAPGLCSALLTTLAGLLVAIPSLLGYNFLVGRIRLMISRLDHFAGELASIFDRNYVDHHAAGSELPSLGSLGSPNLPAFTGAPAPGSPRLMTTAPATRSAAAAATSAL